LRDRLRGKEKKGPRSVVTGVGEEERARLLATIEASKGKRLQDKKKSSPRSRIRKEGRVPTPGKNMKKGGKELQSQQNLKKERWRKRLM